VVLLVTVGSMQDSRQNIRYAFFAKICPMENFLNLLYIIVVRNQPVYQAEPRIFFLRKVIVSLFQSGTKENIALFEFFDIICAKEMAI
jgi:hypothetical protein